MIIYYQDNHDCMFAANIIYNNRKHLAWDDGTNVKLVPYRYSRSDILKILDTKETVVILGIGFFANDPKSIERVRTIIQRSKKVIWIDGHENTEDLMQMFPEIETYYDKGRATSFILHYKILKRDYNLGVDLIAEKQTYPNPSMACICLYLYILSVYSDPSDIVWNEIYESNNLDPLINTGLITIDFLKQQNIFAIENFGYRSILNGEEVIALNADHRLFLPDVVYTQKIPILFWQFDGNMYRYFLYKANSKVNCLEIARNYNSFGTDYRATFVLSSLIAPRKEKE